MFNRIFFTLVLRLLASRLVRDYAEYHGPNEDTRTARLGPLELEVNECFVLDHADASVSLTVPLGRRRWLLVCMACRGTEPIRRAGFRVTRW